MRLALALTVILVTLSATHVAAQTRPLVPLGNATVVIVWKNDKARSEGADLIAAGVAKTNPMLIAPLVACVVPPGTQAIKTDGGFFTSDILVTSGTHSGCRGNVANEHLGKVGAPATASASPAWCSSPGDLWDGKTCSWRGGTKKK